MLSRYVFLGAMLATAGLGCGPSTGRVDNDPANYARMVKKQVLEFVQMVKQNPNSTAHEAAILLENLEIYPSQPVGEHLATYEALTTKCKELVDAAKRSPRSAEVSKKVNEMAALANKLPGEVKLSPDVPSGDRPVS